VKETEHYTVKTSVSDDYTAKMAEEAELAYAEYEEIFKRVAQRRNKGKKAVLYVFKTNTAYYKYFGDALGRADLARMTLGVFSSEIKQLILFDREQIEQALETVYHEAWHQYLDNYLEYAPFWFNESGGWRSAPAPLSPERLLESKESRARVDVAIAALPEQQRLVIELRDVAGLESDEVCELLKLSANNQRVLLHRARDKVRAALATRG
jgi:RNA polymerase sigma factor (sigma-70 family)